MNSGSLHGKVAVVTGSSRGIGAAIVKHLAREGASVVVVYAGKKDKADEVVKEITGKGGKAIALQCDVTDVASISALMDAAKAHYGRLDICVSNAGIENFSHFLETTPEEFDATFRVNTRGQFFVMQQAAKRMEHGGRLICMSSVSAFISVPKHAVYAASKGALPAMVKNIAKDVGAKGITVNAIAPGATKSDMFDEVARDYLDPTCKDDVDTQVKRMSPLSRVGQPDDIANAITFLASDAGGWITGQVIHSNGGMF
ncbi:hypothetical protein RI367_008820 [Sorochytrium milnesiophthora]